MNGLARDRTKPFNSSLARNAFSWLDQHRSAGPVSAKH